MSREKAKEIIVETRKLLLDAGFIDSPNRIKEALAELEQPDPTELTKRRRNQISNISVLINLPQTGYLEANQYKTTIDKFCEIIHEDCGIIDQQAARIKELEEALSLAGNYILRKENEDLFKKLSKP